MSRALQGVPWDPVAVSEQWTPGQGDLPVTLVVHALAFDDEARVLLRPAGTGSGSTAGVGGTVWSLPSAPARAGEDPDETARLLAPALYLPNGRLPRRPVPLRGYADRAHGPPFWHLVYGVDVPVPVAVPRSDSGLWWQLSEVASLRLDAAVRHALVLGWPLFPTRV